MKTTLIFVRHAEAVGNKIREFHGWTDANITERGHVQAKLVAERLSDVKIDVIYSSVLKRTMETAAYISGKKGLPVIPREDLKEIHGGRWEGMRWEDLEKYYPEEYYTWENKPHLHQMPEGESMTSFQRRVVKAVQDILSREHGKNICIVTHGTVIRVLLCWFKGLPLEEVVTIPWCDNTAVTIVTEENGKFCVVLEGCAGHLSQETSTLLNQEWYKEYTERFFKNR